MEPFPCSKNALNATFKEMNGVAECLLYTVATFSQDEHSASHTHTHQLH